MSRSDLEGKTIHDVLQMPVGEAVSFFKNHKKIHRTLETLNAVGLSYIRLGQPATTLSGGEAQRVKLASELRSLTNIRYTSWTSQRLTFI